MNIRELLKKGPVVFDGAMGTYISSYDKTCAGMCEQANQSHSELVYKIHKEYMNAGAKVITANTFAANRLNFDEQTAKRLLKEGFEIARKASGNEAAVVASIGPVSTSENIVSWSKEKEYKWVAERLLDCGAENYIFETQADLEGILETSEFIKSKNPNAFIIVSFSVNSSGYTQEGMYVKELLTKAGSREAVDAVGLNCGLSAYHMKAVAEELKKSEKPFLVMPNAGYPVIVNRRTVYEGNPEFFASECASMFELGVKMFGGCCGTTPKHIKALRECLDSLGVTEIKSAKNSKTSATESGKASGFSDSDKTTKAEQSKEKPFDPGSRFFEKLKAGEKPIAVELDSPQNADTTKFLHGVKDLKEADVDIITIADCPIGRARMDSSLLACKIHREYGVEALPHLTCRDRNLNATEALMLGLYAEGIRNFLLVTGDPLPAANRDEVKTVYQFNSRKFAAFATSLSDQLFPGDAHFFGALNVNARNFDVQLKLAKEKIENGMVGFLTQPVLTPEAFENLKRAKEELDAYILGGIIPVVSERNARFMNSEINGINVDDKITKMYAEKSREESEEIAVSVSSEIARRIAPYVDGYYFMTPFQRTSLIKRIIEAI